MLFRSVERLDKVQWWLRVCGARITTRPLHSLKGFYCREIVVSDRADLHLCWDPSSSRMFIKPLPAYLLNIPVWKEQICKDRHLYRNSLGFLRTYVHLIPEECDFYSAREEGLLPRTYQEKEEGSELTWPKWCDFVGEFVTGLEGLNEGQPGDTLNRVPDILRGSRWEYSELRLNRLSQVYRFRLRKVFRGYTFSYQSYGSFLSRNSNWLIAAFAYVAIVHGAMQVGLGTPQLVENEMFLNASYGFSVFSIIAPISILFLIILWIVLMFVDNLIHMVLRTQKWDKNHNKKGDVEMHPSIPRSEHSDGQPQ